LRAARPWATAASVGGSESSSIAPDV
jgi:hypothetical protein